MMMMMMMWRVLVQAVVKVLRLVKRYHVTAVIRQCQMSKFILFVRARVFLTDVRCGVAEPPTGHVTSAVRRVN